MNDEIAGALENIRKAGEIMKDARKELDSAWSILCFSVGVSVATLIQVVIRLLQ